eukprot:scaffold544_cov256-Pinguiococcus_pyrenoidosus.AAC.14
MSLQGTASVRFASAKAAYERDCTSTVVAKKVATAVTSNPSASVDEATRSRVACRSSADRGLVKPPPRDPSPAPTPSPGGSGARLAPAGQS